jgi:hypothetical protein
MSEFAASLLLLSGAPTWIPQPIERAMGGKLSIDLQVTWDRRRHRNSCISIAPPTNFE